MVDGVAVTLAVLGPQVLVLPVVILDRDADPRRGKAELEERDMVAAAAEAVGAPDLPHVEPDLQPVREAVEIARDVARRAVVLTPEAVRRRREIALPLRPGPFRQHPHMGRIAHAIGRATIADNIVVEDRDDVPALRLGIICKGFAAIEALLL